MVPVTGSPDVCTETLVSLPPAAVTLIPAPGLTFLLPLAGVMASCTAGLGEVLALLCAGRAAEPAAAGPLLPEQRAASRPAAVHKTETAAAARTRFARSRAGCLRLLAFCTPGLPCRS